ncbi:MAG: flippase-like domain-containing protein [Methanomassiliicoccales archaeon]|nr:flippase-like domain-containing protein [Methanomassiliicoccales archaeon]
MKLGVSATLIILVVLVSNPEAVGEALQNVDPNLILLVIVLYLINLVVKAYRWGVLLGQRDHVLSFRTIFTAFSLSQAINNLIPGRVVGETSRIVEMNSKQGVSVGHGLATVVTERVMDFVLLTLLTVSSLFLLLTDIISELRGYLILMVAIMVLANLFFLYLLARPALMVRMGAWGARLVERFIKGERGRRYSVKIMDTVQAFNETLTYKGRWRPMMWASVLTVIIWVNEIVRLFFIIEALGVNVSMVAVIATTSLASLSTVMLSAGSGNVVMSSAVLSAAGLDPYVAATAGLLSAMTSIWLSVPVSLIAMTIDHRRRPCPHPRRDKNVQEEKRGFN